MTDIVAELAGRPPGGRNSAAYTAGLKAGSLLSAARATPGGEQASAAWTDEAAEQALVDAAQRNGYVDKDGEPDARRAIRSGLRNGLRQPRALPDFSASRPAQSTPPRPQGGHGREPAPPDIRQEIEATDQAASTTSRCQHQDPAITVPQPDSLRIQADRAAVAANQSYRTGDLDAAQQLTDQAATLDPSRADLWQQHREQIAARSLILGAQAAHADGDHQRAQDLLDQARQLDPRMPAIWDGDLPGLPPTRTVHHSREHEAAPRPDGPAESSRTVARGAGTKQRARAVAATADQGPPQPSWPRSPARSQPGLPAPRSAEETSAQPTPQRDPAVSPRQPEAQAEIAAGDTQPDTEPADDDPSSRWPAPNPRAARQTSPPGRRGTRVVAASEASRPPERAGIAARAEVGDTTNSRDPAASPDWRDQLLTDARRSWQPISGQPSDPSASFPSERQASRTGIEPDT